MYILEAALEYLIAILVSGSFFATITKELGFSDSLTGILSSIISLGCLFQLISMTVRRHSYKRFVILMSVANQLLFTLLYVIPLAGVGKNIQAAVFVIAILCAYFLYNVAHPKKINWLMSLVDDSKRGIFTANKEIVSLICGMIFSFAMGSLVDHFAEKGEIKTAFIICAFVIAAISVFHTVTMLLTPEKSLSTAEKKNILNSFADVIKNKKVLSVTVIFILYHIANYMTVPFYGTYTINELGFNLKYVAFLSILSSIVRVLVSRAWGKYADKHSFACALEKCLLVLFVSYICVALSTPQTGKVMFALYHIIHGIAMGGINSAMINLIFDYVAPAKRSDSLAVCQATAGLFGFLSTIAASPVVRLIQQNGNTVLGVTVYAQQLLSVFGAVIVLGTILFIRFAIIKKAVNSRL